MAIRNVVKSGDEILTKKAREVTTFDRRLYELLDDMAETMYAENGVGLAAVQVGVLKRVVVIDTGDGLLELVNPKVLTMKGDQYGREACLSFPGESAMVHRPMKVTVEALNRHGEEILIKGSGLLARALCHEIDHLNGVVFKMRAAEQEAKENK